MDSGSAWPRAAGIETARLILEPLRVDHAAELAAALNDQELHRYIGGQPATVEELRSRFAVQIVGHSPDGAESTGYASEASGGMLDWLGQHGVCRVNAHIHPEHPASIGVAKRLGLTPTEDVADEEIRWTLPPEPAVPVTNDG